MIQRTDESIMRHSFSAVDCIIFSYEMYQYLLVPYVFFPEHHHCLPILRCSCSLRWLAPWRILVVVSIRKETQGAGADCLSLFPLAADCCYHLVDKIGRREEGREEG
jgi:hypothetical protein